MTTGGLLTVIVEEVSAIPATRSHASGVDALRHLENCAGHDVVFSDVVMPGMSGVQLGQRSGAVIPASWWC